MWVSRNGKTRHDSECRPLGSIGLWKNRFQVPFGLQTTTPRRGPAVLDRHSNGHGDQRCKEQLHGKFANGVHVDSPCCSLLLSTNGFANAPNLSHKTSHYRWFRDRTTLNTVRPPVRTN